MRNEERRDPREPERVKVNVKGTHPNGVSFEEQTETVDLSMIGLSFYLRTPISVRTFLSIELGESRLLTHIRKVQALVVRIDTSSPGKQLVAVQFL
jgi:PilZ domain